MAVLSSTYGLYAFQLVPIERHRQALLFKGMLEPQALIARKN